MFEPYLFETSRAWISGVMVGSFVFCFAAARRRSRMGERGNLREQLLRGESQAVDDRENLGPLLIQKALTLAGQQQPPSPVAHVHTATAALFHQAFVDELLIPLEHG